MAEAAALPGPPSPGPRNDAIGRMLASPRVVAGGGVLVLFVLAAVFAPLLAPHDPVEQDLMLQYVLPVWDERAEPGYLFGTDNLGRDILSRLLHGARVALFVAVTAAAVEPMSGPALHGPHRADETLYDALTRCSSRRSARFAACPRPSLVVRRRMEE